MISSLYRKSFSLLMKRPLKLWGLSLLQLLDHHAPHREKSAHQRPRLRIPFVHIYHLALLK